MTKKDYIKIATAIWRSGAIKDKDKKRQEAKENMRRLVAFNLSSELKQDNPKFNKNNFLEACSL